MSDLEMKQIMDKLNNMEQRMATKDDIKDMATRDDIKNMATKDDIKDMVTKDDIKNMATRADIQELRTEMNTRFNNVDGELQVIRKQVAHNSEFEPTIHELKIRVDEQDQDIKIMKRELNRRR